MKPAKLFLTVTLISMLTGCVTRKAFYVSPFNGQNNPYHTIPLKQDSIRSAFYINAALASGSANDNQGDQVFSANVSLSHSLNFGDFQAYYGLALATGSYRVDRFDEGGVDDSVDPAIINANAGKKSFGGYGFDAGINYTVPLKNAEWRILGIETSLRKEFGSYLAFRKMLPFTAATLIFKNDSYATAGGYTEIVGRSGKVTLGFKVGLGKVLGREYRNVRSIVSDYDDQRLLYNYATATMHLSKNKWTGYLQFNDAAKATFIFAGTNYRLGK